MTLQDEVLAALEGTTPGPWHYHDRGAGSDIRAVADRILIADPSWHGSIRKHFPLKAESQANAKLIAAAPDLLTRLSAALTEAEKERDEATAAVEKKEARFQAALDFMDKIMRFCRPAIGEKLWVRVTQFGAAYNAKLAEIDADIAKGAAS